MSNRHTTRLKMGASLGAIALLTMPGVALAQDDSLETVVVTGTLIKGINPVGTNLVTFDAKAIQASGAQSTNQILSNIPQITTAFNTMVNDTTGATGGGFRPAIRNITQPGGGTTTLTLVDGHNIVGIGGLQTVPDPGYLPTVAIQRVDVVPDGAAALYGANATTGIINFITRDSFEGLQLNVAAGFANGYTSTNDSIIGGHNWGSGGAYLSYEYHNQSFQMQSVHPYNRQNLTDIGGADNRITTCPLANITVGSTTYHETALPGDSQASFSASLAPGAVKCENWQNISQAPKQEQNTFFGGIHQHIMDGVDFDMKALWGSRQTTQATAQYVSTQVINNTNPYFRTIFPGGTETQQTVAFAFNSGSNGVNSVNNTSRDTMFNIVPEVVFSELFGDWEAKLQANYSRSAHIGMSNAFNAVYLANGMRTQTGGPTLSKTGQAANALDPYNLGLSNASVYQSMYLSGGTLGKSIGEQTQVRLALDGSLFELPGGTVKAVIGGQYGVDYYDGSWFNGPVGQMDPPAIPGGVYQISKKRRYIGSVFGEVVIPVVGANNAMPLVESFTIDLSGRHDDYSDFGSTDNPKVGFTWDVFDALTVRGNLGTSFNAPSLADITAPDARFQLQTYTSPNTALPTVRPDGVAVSAADALRPTILVPGGNPLLSPEKANTWSVGAEFHPHEMFGTDFTGLDIAVTRWHVGEHNQIGLACYQGTTFPTCASIPAYNRFYIYNPTLAQLQTAFDYRPGLPLLNFPGTDLASLYSQNTNGGAACPTVNAAAGCNVVTPFVVYDARRNNLGNVQLEGVDFHVSDSFDTAWGTLSGGVDGTYSLSNKYQGADGQPLVSRQAWGAPLYTASVYLGLTSGPLTSKLTLNYTPSYALDPVQDNARKVYGQNRIGDFAPLNLYVGYDLDDLYDWTQGATAGVTINNMFDHDPPIKKTGGTTAYATSLGRFIEVSFTKKF